MPYRELHGNIFASKADALVNTVNCVGPMGKGIALEFRRRFPEMYEAYREVCERSNLLPGSILPYRKSSPWVLNFAVKNDWKHPSKVEWIEQCLEKFCSWYPKVGLNSVAFPWMGAMNGGIPLETIKEVTRNYLQDLDDIEIEVYGFDPDVSDPLFDKLLELKRSATIKQFSFSSGIQKHRVEKLYAALEQDTVTSITHIVQSGIFGKTLLDKLYLFLIDQLRQPPSERPNQQLDLF